MQLIRPRTLATLAGLALAGASPALAQTVGDPAAGRRIAEVWCANCHVIAPGGPGPATDAVPSLPAVAQRAATTELSLRVFLQTPHANMPNYQLSRTETDDLVAYILSLKQRR
jgi:mono/diheme cytochrome c family protein